MNEKENALLYDAIEGEDFDFDELERQLEAGLEDSLSELEFLEEDKKKISNPDNLGNAVMNVVWDQFIIQIGAVAGDDFIKENQGLKLDLRDEAHILTAEGFEKGNLPTHNFENKEKYERRYEETRADFQTDPNMEVKMSKNMRYDAETKTYERYDSNSKEWVGKTRYNEETKTWEDYNPRNSKWEKKLAPDAREKFDTRTANEKGSKTVNKDHVISAAEQIRDNEAAAYMDRGERQDFAKSDVNIQDLDSAANQSKSDLSTEEWLKEKRKDGQSQAEYFGVDEDELKKKDKAAREEYEKKKKDAKEKAINEGRKSQKAEAFRIGGKALRAAIMALLAELVRNIIGKLIAWLKSAEKSLKSFLAQVKEAIAQFLRNIKKNLLTAGTTIASTVLSAIFGPIVGAIQKIWTLIKQGGKSVKEAIDYVKKPENRKKSFGVLMLEIGKIVMTGLTAMGALVLGEVIEKGLMTYPVFAFEIPLIGSLANVIGIFLGAVVAGIAGALILNLIDRMIAKKRKQEITEKQIEKGNEVLAKQAQVIAVNQAQLQRTKAKTGESIRTRHEEAADEMRKSVDNIFTENAEDNSAKIANMKSLLDQI